MDIARLQRSGLKTQSIVYDDSIDTSSIQNVLLIDDSVKDFQQYANAGTFPIIYNRWCRRDQLLEVLTSKFQNISRIAVVSHFNENPYFLNEDILFSDTNTQFIVDVAKQFHLSHIDFLACNTLQSTSWTTFYATVYDATGVSIGASNDSTGNLKYGGDWILESTHEDIQTIYFNDQIPNYSSLLLAFTYTHTEQTLSYSTIDASTVSVDYVNTISGSVTIPTDVSYNNITYNVTSIGNNAFYNCTDLTTISFASPSLVASIGTYAFYNCIKLTTITIPSSVTSIDAHAFYKCTGLTTITIPSSVTSIGNNAFELCNGLTTISFASPSLVTSISVKAFYNFTDLTTITTPSSDTSIGTYAFFVCTGLTSITVDDSNANYSSDSFGVLFDKDKTTLIQYPVENNRITYIPSTKVFGI